MHELSIAHALVTSVTAAVADQPGRVTEVHVRVGALSGVVREALEFAYDVAADGTPLAGSRVVVVEVPAVVHCASCDLDSELVERLFFACPVCGEPTGDVRGGHELDVSHVVLDDEPAGVPA